MGILGTAPCGKLGNNGGHHYTDFQTALQALAGAAMQPGSQHDGECGHHDTDRDNDRIQTAYREAVGILTTVTADNSVTMNGGNEVSLGRG